MSEIKTFFIQLMTRESDTIDSCLKNKW